MRWKLLVDIYLKQTLASGMIPQITAVFGTCGGGMAIVPALTDFTFIEAKKGKIFVNSLQMHWMATTLKNVIQQMLNSRAKRQVLLILLVQKKKFLDKSVS